MRQGLGWKQKMLAAAFTIGTCLPLRSLTVPFRFLMDSIGMKAWCELGAESGAG